VYSVLSPRTLSMGSRPRCRALAAGHKLQATSLLDLEAWSLKLGA
jgi:hypothetical protein